MLKSPPGWFDRPFLGDALKGLGLAVVFAAVVILPQVLLPWHVVRWVMIAVMAMMLWVIGFMIVRTRRETRRSNAEDAAHRAQWAAKDAARAARRVPLDDTPGEKYGEGS